ncbi:hypothetical protein GBK02_10290 [Dechloromonas sp. TW-R-39-2]|uniref:hypothetical protein n=1 Tax=Dechloromonas sp. TW-R-39-2 TaxID=2654218 RepID=UPI00193E7193|nr:hypothetical protein [Dechloromonas sp. TW-R-39-2]QRM19763.1 hypothetical protein GBK02_10290 [Dechloromonas sp. TW-R-39-2]
MPMLRRKKTRIDAAFWRIDKSSGAGSGIKQTAKTIAAESSSIYNFSIYPQSYPRVNGVAPSLPNLDVSTPLVFISRNLTIS